MAAHRQQWCEERKSLRRFDSVVEERCETGRMAPSDRMMHMRRWAISIVVALLLGAVVNIAVAWGCCMYAYRDSSASVALRHPPTDAELAWWRSVNPPQGVMEPREIWPTSVVGYTETRHLGPGPIITKPNGEKI